MAGGEKTNTEWYIYIYIYMVILLSYKVSPYYGPKEKKILDFLVFSFIKDKISVYVKLYNYL